VQAKSETAMLTTFNEVNMAPSEVSKRHGEEFLELRLSWASCPSS
jgi:hypothetical protein